MGKPSTTAYYGAGKKLRAANTWEAVCADIERRLACEDLSCELCFLSFAGRKFTAETWGILEHIFQQLTCATLDLQNCGIKDVSPFLDFLLPKIAPTTRCFNFEGNALSTRSVRQLTDALGKACTQPSWLSIGEDAQKSSSRFLMESNCYPFHRRGCLCTKRLVVHVVPHLPKFDRAKKQRWQEKYLASHEANTLQPSCTKFVMSDDSHEWPALPRSTPPAPPSSPTTTTCEFLSDDFVETDSGDSEFVVHAAPALPNHGEILIRWIEEERRARVSALARLTKYCSDYASMRSLARTAHDEVLDKVTTTSWTIGGSALLLSVADDRRLHLLDVTQSLACNELVTVGGNIPRGLSPVFGFTFQARALPFSSARAEQHELKTIGGESLEIDKDSDHYLLEGWVAARVIGGITDFLWFPLDHIECCESSVPGFSD